MGIKDIEKVIITACAGLGIVPLSRIYIPDDYPDGKVDNERIVIHVKRQQRGDIFYKGFVEVNAVVPDNGERANHDRLDAIEDILVEAFKYDVCGEFDGDTYRYGLYSHEIFREEEAKFHYVNARLTFEILNI